MQKTISEILVVGSDRNFREQATRALARTQAKLIFAISGKAAELEVCRYNLVPGLVIEHVEYQEPENPIGLYHFMRGTTETRFVPFIHIVETDFEFSMMMSMKLKDACVMRPPLNFATLVYALPALGLEIKESVLYEQKNPFAPEISHFWNHDTAWANGRIA